MKKLIALFGMALMLYVSFRAVRDFDTAKTTGNSLKGLFWLVVSSLAFYGFLDDFKKDRWPL